MRAYLRLCELADGAPNLLLLFSQRKVHETSTLLRGEASGAACRGGRARAFDEERLQVEVAGGGPPGIDPPVDLLRLLDREAGGGGRLFRRDAVIRSEETEIHLVLGKSEVEL